MKLFISWSGQHSYEIAEALNYWIKLVLQNVEPWVSSKDINPGERWSHILNKELNKTDVGILCLTPDNLNSNWLHFEAGALGKSVKSSKVIPVLHNLKPEDLIDPIKQFQSLLLNKDGLFKLVKTLKEISNSTLEEKHLETTFEALYPIFEKDYKKIKSQEKEGEKRAVKSDRDLIEEILIQVKGIKVSPTESDIIESLNYLLVKKSMELDKALKDEEELTRQDAPISLEDRIIIPLQNQIVNIRGAIEALSGK